ncbi:transposase [Streptomyces tauricus]|uniref:transposase n=1 Tax=Streptomyces tauricus TaxID=68274 RepID=UPI0022432322|nr:transposase [Streptomyces tauricus]MCW8103024.1 transposase [Streptomyces tauricus]
MRPATGGQRSVFYQQFLQQVEDSNPTGEIWIVADSLSSHNSVSTRTWIEDHPRIHHAFIPVGACWLNLQERWWYIFRKASLAGRSFANPTDRHHPSHDPRNRPAQLPCTSMGLGPSRHHQPALHDAAMCTSFEESGTSRDAR